MEIVDQRTENEFELAAKCTEKGKVGKEHQQHDKRFNFCEIKNPFA